MFRFSILLALLAFAIQAKTQNEKVSTVPEMQPLTQALFHPLQPASTKGDLDQAWAFLEQNRARLKLTNPRATLQLKAVRSSLLGKHYSFVQMLHGYEIEDTEVTVSIHFNGPIYRVTNHSVPLADAPVTQKTHLMDAESAMLLAWHHLGVSGTLSDIPQAEVCYLQHKGRLSLVYRVQMKTSDPLGDWRVAVDAVNGDILEVHNRHIYHRRYDGSDTPQELTAIDGGVGDFHAALQLVRASHTPSSRDRQKASTKRSDGRGMVFDPDPRTTLQDDSLQDSSPVSDFEDAYVEQPLRDISLNQGIYRLNGPWVEMADLNAPSNEPTTTTDGYWNFPRGNLGLNEATAYFHLDQSQRYLQSLGYSGETGLQEAPIQVDVKAFGGLDRSAFNSPNELWFGTGCVDDSEDADVLLHEYGHAIQYAINANFFARAHEGAMGEGFGDYWASSYGLSRPNGYAYFPSRVFNWDASLGCWEGRAADKFNLIYDHNVALYGVHESIPGGVTDEIWSTPLFQTLLELYRQGIPRQEVDRIILEAQFGLGINQKMRLVAESIVQTATMLHPDGPHAAMFREYFANHGILDSAVSFEYIAPHVPPNRTSQDWQSEILLFNPNTVSAQVELLVFESNELGQFSSHPLVKLTLEPGETQAFVPEGMGQRWVQLSSTQPLAGTQFFMRQPSGELGTEKAGIPLLSDTEMGTSLILPHIPADRASFWSGAVLLNPQEVAADVSLELIGTQGSDLSHLLNADVRTQLGPREKWVTFLSEGPAGATGTFNDSTSPEKVSYIRIHSSGKLAAFELFGYNGNTGAVATAGITALPDQTRTLLPLHVGVDDTDFASFSILNPTEAPVAAKVTVFDAQSNPLAQTTLNMDGRSKALGLNLKDGSFVFPVDHPQAITLEADQVSWMIIEASAPLRVFELSGDNTRTRLDGAAVMGPTTRIAFSKPRGTLHVFQGLHSGTITLKTTAANGSVTEQRLDLEAGAAMRIPVPDATQNLDLSGALFNANLVDNDPATGALTQLKGSQIRLGQHMDKFKTEVVDDHGNDFSKATLATLEGIFAGQIEYAGDADFFRFEVTQAGRLIVGTTGSTDTIGSLYDSNENAIVTTDDISTANFNFEINQNVFPGTYYLKITSYLDTTGAYTLYSSFTATPTSQSNSETQQRQH